MIRAIIFDCFGVLVGSGFDDTYRAAGGDSAKDAAFIDDLLTKASSGAITSEQYNQLVADKLGIGLQQWLDVVRRFEVVNPLVLEEAKRLKSSYKLAILSNANTGLMERRFTPEQAALFDVVVISAEIGFLKPDHRVYEYTAQKLGVMPSECVFIDDNEPYCQAARDVGMQAICYRGFDQMKNELDKILATNANH